MATIRIEDEQVSGKGYAYGLCGFADLRTDYARSTGAKHSNPRCFLTKTDCIKEKRHFIGFELNKQYYDKASTVDFGIEAHPLNNGSASTNQSKRIDTQK